MYVRRGAPLDLFLCVRCRGRTRRVLWVAHKGGRVCVLCLSAESVTLCLPYTVAHASFSLPVVCAERGESYLVGYVCILFCCACQNNPLGEEGTGREPQQQIILRHPLTLCCVRPRCHSALRFQPPNALVLQLKRFVFARKACKVRDHVSFADTLNLKVSGPERSAAYDLTG